MEVSLSGTTLVALALLALMLFGDRRRDD